jgi:RNA polymerase sigma-70 factor (ECF subfamily)
MTRGGSDHDLVARAQAGDSEAFSRLTERRTDRLYAAARLILRDDDLARDVVQDTLLRAWQSCRGLRDPDRLDAWLHRILVRHAYRAAGRRKSREVVEIQVAFTAETTTPDTQTSVATRDQLDRGFRRLSTQQRTVIVLYHYLGLSMAESAEVLGIPLGTVQSRLNRATAALRSALDADARSTNMVEEAVR